MMFDKSRASLLGLGTISAIQSVAGATLFFDTPAVAAGSHWIVAKASVWYLHPAGGAGTEPDLALTGVFLIPPGTVDGAPIGGLMAPSIRNWWFDGMEESDDHKSFHMEFDIPFILPSGWKLRFILGGTGTNPALGDTLIGSYLYEVEDNC